MRVYAVLIDPERQRVALNLKDSTLPAKLVQYEGKIGLFGGAVEDGEDALAAIHRELLEEIPGFLVNYVAFKLPLDTPEAIFYRVCTDLSGTRYTRATDRVGLLARVCLEGDAVVRSYSWVREQPVEQFVDPMVRTALFRAIKPLGGEVTE